MSISFRCEQCAKAFNVVDELAGKKAKCKGCNHVMRIPYASEIGPPPKSSSGSRPKTKAEAIDDDDGNPYRVEKPSPKPSRRPASVFDDDDFMAKPRPASASNSEEEAPPLNPMRGLPPQKKYKDESKASKFFDSESGWGGRSAFGILITVGLIGLRIFFRMNRNQAPAPADNPPLAFNGPQVGAAAPFVPNAGPTVIPPLPDRPVGKEIEPGVLFQAIKMGAKSPGPDVLPAHGMTLRLYLPTHPGEAIPERSLPCVMIAPAGSILVTGNELSLEGDGHQSEHLPWVRAGFAVLAYGLDGEVGDMNNNSDIAKAASTFVAAKAGLINAEVALEWLLKKVPEVDPDRLYTAGHSSAATMALLLAENEPRIKAVAAFAPAADVGARFDGPQKGMLRSLSPGMDLLFTTYNPALHTDKINCPIFLFSARDDNNVTIDINDAFAGKLKSEGKQLTYETVPTGGHYTAMINEGIPMAIEWVKGIDQGKR